MQLQYKVFHQTEFLGQGSIETPFQLGRQDNSELDLKPVCISGRGGMRRLIFATISADRSIPRKALNVTTVANELIVQNIHESSPIDLGNGRLIWPSEKAKIVGETVFHFADGYRVVIGISKDSPHPVPSRPVDAAVNFRTIRLPAPESEDEDSQYSLTDLPKGNPQVQAVDLVKTALRAFREVPGTDRFYETVVNAVTEMIDVDRAIVLLRTGDRWLTKATTIRRDSSMQLPGDPSNYSHSLVQKVVDSKQTVVVEPDERTVSVAKSMANIQRAVASPIFDENRDVVAILYADKRLGGTKDRPIGDLEATLLDVLASAVSTGISRQNDREFRAEAGQFFSKEVLDRLRTQKDLLEGRDTEVSVLFCDIRGYSTVSHRADPKETLKWINDVLTNLSECVLRHDGVVVDYVGDELMAMFGAPEPQPDHADRAARAAIDMLRLVPELNRKWRDLVLDKFSVGVGVNTGHAIVGNTGSQIKYKYGPLGNTVNMASRIQGITKQIGVPGLVAGSTFAALGNSFLTRRLTGVRVVGISDPIELFQLLDEDTPAIRNLCSRYEEALVKYEHAEFAEATGLLGSLVRDYPSDSPTRQLLARVVTCLSRPDQPFDPIWTLSHK